ncbi:MAG: hypothetical protein ACERKD_11515 [Prolixibacteraceae bacterium]
MKLDPIVLITIFLISSCALTKPAVVPAEIQLNEIQFNSLVKESVNTCIQEAWLSDFLNDKNERPVVLISKISNDAKIQGNLNTGTSLFESEFIKSGQVRVVKSTEQQQNISPTDLVKGESVDYVISANFIKQIESSPAIIIFVVSLWGDDSTLPILEVKKELNTNLSEY